MERPVVNPGRVDWSGENPCIWLRERAEAPFVSLATLFRVVYSPHGGGHAAFVLLDPLGQGDSIRQNICCTDNEPLARYLAENFVANFGAFKVPGFGALSYRPADRFEHSGDARNQWVERVAGPGVDLELVWDRLDEPYFVEIPAEKTPRRHEIFTLFIDAAAASIRLNGFVAPGKPGARDVHGQRTASTAFLAFSETWVEK